MTESRVGPRALGGVWQAGGAYLLWGLLPVYWKLLGDVPAREILAHRMVWSLAVVLGLLVVQRRWRWIGAAAGSPRVVVTFAASALLLSANWYIYIWAVNESHVVETSLGYFFTPLVNVGLGVALLRERLRPGQTVALLIAAAAVVYLTVQYGSLPWIALSLAVTFGLYGLLRKTAPLGSLEGFAVETLLLFLPALAYLLYLASAGTLVFGRGGPATAALLVLSGAVTALPLLLFAAGARRIPLSTLGVLQYIAPSLQFVLGVFAYGEPMRAERLAGFALVWLALAIYTAEGLRHRQLRRRSDPAVSGTATP